LRNVGHNPPEERNKRAGVNRHHKGRKYQASVRVILGGKDIVRMY